MKGTVIRKLLMAVGLLALLGTTIFLIVMWGRLPEQVATHYNAAGEIDQYGGKGNLVLPLFIGWMLYCFLGLVSRIGAISTELRKTPAMWNMLAALKLIIALDFSYLTVCGALGRGLGVWFLPVFLTAIFGTIIISVLRTVRKG